LEEGENRYEKEFRISIWNHRRQNSVCITGRPSGK